MGNLLKKIATEFGLSTLEATVLVRSAPKRYKVFQIDKRDGSKRTVAQPAKELKIIQRWLVKDVISDLPIHDAATAYRPNRGIKYNALKHAKNSYLLKMDFKKYFPSIKGNDLAQHIDKYLDGRFDSSDISIICNIALWWPKGSEAKGPEGLELCIGGPSSPFISNSIAYDFDVIISNECDRRGVTYTRYADDLSFSTNEKDILGGIEDFVLTTCKDVGYPHLTINAEKTVHVSKKHKRFVTGVTLSNEGNISLGRERKRKIRSAIHKYIHGALSPEMIMQLRGIIAFALDVEPSFVSSMRNKYGDKTIQEILKWEKRN